MAGSRSPRSGSTTRSSWSPGTRAGCCGRSRRPPRRCVPRCARATRPTCPRCGLTAVRARSSWPGRAARCSPGDDARGDLRAEVTDAGDRRVRVPAPGLGRRRRPGDRRVPLRARPPRRSRWRPKPRGAAATWSAVAAPGSPLQQVALAARGTFIPVTSGGPARAMPWALAVPLLVIGVPARSRQGRRRGVRVRGGRHGGHLAPVPPVQRVVRQPGEVAGARPRRYAAADLGRFPARERRGTAVRCPARREREVPVARRGAA